MIKKKKEGLATKGNKCMNVEFTSEQLPGKQETNSIPNQLDIETNMRSDRDKDIPEEELPEDDAVSSEEQDDFDDQEDTVILQQLDALQKTLEEREAQIEDLTQQKMRAHAELENYRKRSEKEMQNVHKFALERFLNQLLPVADSFNLGLGAMDDDSTDTKSLAAFKEGILLIKRSFDKVLQNAGVSEVNPQGELFNPEKHEAVSIQESDEHTEDTIVQVVRKGYALNGRLMRPAMVIIAKPKS